MRVRTREHRGRGRCAGTVHHLPAGCRPAEAAAAAADDGGDDDGGGDGDGTMPEAETAERPRPHLGQNSAGADAAWSPGDASAEIERVLSAPNYYAVLHVTPHASLNEMKRNYKKLSLVLHPDRCQAPRAKEAFQEVSTAHVTLANPMKRKMYDLYLGDRVERSGNAETYTEWEARHAAAPHVTVPKWLLFILRLPVIGMIVALLLLLLLLPVLLIMIVLMFVLGILCLPCAALRMSMSSDEQQQGQQQQQEQQEAAWSGHAGESNV